MTKSSLDYFIYLYVQSKYSTYFSTQIFKFGGEGQITSFRDETLGD